MKERPILFSSPMVRALLAGTKTQTRRVLKDLPVQSQTTPNTWGWWAEDGCLIPTEDADGIEGPRCPYGQPGDRLWVRETWAQTDGRHERVPVAYRATDEGRALLDDRWRPSIHMPRWASRITLEVIAVRVERLQGISEADVRAEGVELRAFWLFGSDSDGRRRIASTHYRSLWESINGAGSWNTNPWVWVIKFRRVKNRG